MLPEDLNAHYDDLVRTADDRPWQTPRLPWVVAMRWERVLFMSWEVDQRRLRDLVPPALELDAFDGRTYVSVLPFHMARLHLRDVPPVPDLTAFPEINFRTYVRHEGRPGVWFLSLDASNPLFDWLASHMFHLPYHRAEMSFENDGTTSHLVSARRDDPDVRLDVRFAPVGPVQPTSDLERFLCRRFSTFAVDRHGHLHLGDLHHAEWELRPVDVELRRCDHLRWAGLEPAGEPIMIYADHTDTVMWPPVRA